MDKSVLIMRSVKQWMLLGPYLMTFPRVLLRGHCLFSHLQIHPLKPGPRQKSQVIQGCLDFPSPLLTGIIKAPREMAVVLIKGDLKFSHMCLSKAVLLILCESKHLYIKLFVHSYCKLFKTINYTCLWFPYYMYTFL